MISQGIKVKKTVTDIQNLYFSQSEVVISIPVIFSLAGGYGAHFGGGVLMYSLPYKIYVGIKTSKVPGVRITSMSVKNNRRNVITSFPFSEIFHEKELSDVQKYFYPLAGIDESVGYEVSIYVDHDWIDSGSIQIAMALGILLSSKQISTRFFEDALILRSEEFLVKYRDTILLLWQFQYILNQHSPYPTCGAEIAMAIFPTKYPIFFALQDPAHHPLFQEVGSIDRKSDLTQLSTLKDLSWVVKRFEDEGYNKPFPLDIALVHPGFRKTMSHYVVPGQYETPILGDIQGMADFLEHKKVKTQRLLPDHVHTYTLLAAQCLGQAIHSGRSEDFLFYITKSQNALIDYIFTSKQGETFSKLEAFRHLHGKGSMYLSPKMAGSDIKILIVAPKYALHDIYPELLEAISNENEHAELEYFSHEHAVEKSGAKIERIHLLDENKQCCSLFLSEKKIMFGDHQMSSKEIPSTFFTLKVLAKMKKKRGKILSTSLPMVSYTQNIHDCKEKILKPLMRAIAKYLGLILECHIQKKNNFFEIHFEWQGEIPKFIIR